MHVGLACHTCREDTEAAHSKKNKLAEEPERREQRRQEGITGKARLISDTIKLKIIESSSECDMDFVILRHLANNNNWKKRVK